MTDTDEITESTGMCEFDERLRHEIDFQNLYVRHESSTLRIPV